MNQKQKLYFGQMGSYVLERVELRKRRSPFRHEIPNVLASANKLRNCGPALKPTHLTFLRSCLRAQGPSHVCRFPS